MSESARYPMVENKGTQNSMTELEKECVLQKLWLTYYNDTLYEKGLITEAERNKMRVRIINRASSIKR